MVKKQEEITRVNLHYRFIRILLKRYFVLLQSTQRQTSTAV